MNKIILYNKVQQGISKNAEFDADFGSVKKLSKNSRKKVVNEQVKANVVKNFYDCGQSF